VAMTGAGGGRDSKAREKDSKPRLEIYGEAGVTSIWSDGFRVGTARGGRCGFGWRVREETGTVRRSVV